MSERTSTARRGRSAQRIAAAAGLSLALAAGACSSGPSEVKKEDQAAQPVATSTMIPSPTPETTLAPAPTKTATLSGEASASPTPGEAASPTQSEATKLANEALLRLGRVSLCVAKVLESQPTEFEDEANVRLEQATGSMYIRATARGEDSTAVANLKLVTDPSNPVMAKSSFDPADLSGFQAASLHANTAEYPGEEQTLLITQQGVSINGRGSATVAEVAAFNQQIVGSLLDGLGTNILNTEQCASA